MQAAEESKVQQRRKCVAEEDWGPVTGTICLCSKTLSRPLRVAPGERADHSLDFLPCWFCPGSFLLGPQDYSEHLGWSEACSMRIFLLTTGEVIWEKNQRGWNTTLLLQWEVPSTGF